MGRFGRAVLLVSSAALVAGMTSRSAAQFGQWGFSTQFELSPSIQIEDLDETEAKPQLARLKAYIAAGKWDEAVEALRKLTEEHGQRIVQLSDRRYVSVRDFCHMKVAALPPEALQLYRTRVDQVAGDWYREGVKNRDERQLRNVVEKLFCSSFGDDALLALGDIALERGHYFTARDAWQQISPLMRGAEGQQVWQLLHAVREPKQWDAVLPQFARQPAAVNWVAFPDTDLDLASVRARMALCSILEGSLPRARQELEWLRRLHPTAAGKLAGRDGSYVETLEELLAAGLHWPAKPEDEDWYTFAGNFTRDRESPRRPPTTGKPWWEMSLALVAPNPDQRRADLHPVVVGNVMLLCNRREVFAFDVDTGEPAWPHAQGVPGRIFPGGEQGPRKAAAVESAMVGTPRHTLTVYGDLIFARIGSPVTARATGPTDDESSILVCLSLRQRGALLWDYPAAHHKVEFDRDRWSIEGAPVCDGKTVYVALRRTTFRSEAHVAALDAHSGRLLWRRQVCAADTLAHGSVGEATYNLLTLREDSLYFNTNLGAVAALATHDGAVRWVYRYERARGVYRSDRSRSGMRALPKNFFRDPNPCVYHAGLVMAAPTDSNTVFAVDATTGALTVSWPFHEMDEQPRHLLGVGGGRLIATGNSIWWFDLATNKASGEAIIWPPPTLDGESGVGRGLLAGGRIYWPTQEEIFVLDQNFNGKGSPVLDRIQLTRPDTGDRVTGGNLTLAHDTLLITGPERLFAFRMPPAARMLKATSSPPRAAPSNR